VPSRSPLTLYRVFPWVPDARDGQPGHPLYVPSPQGAGRVDNPELYSVLYTSDSAEGAVGERFGNLSEWSDEMFVVPSMPDGGRALGVYDLAQGAFLDLDDASSLLERELRPSAVVTRARNVTQAWALKIYRETMWAGVRWWGYFNPDWGAFGVWDRSSLSVVTVEPLGRNHEVVMSAAATLNRAWGT
jgi:RES domain